MGASVRSADRTLAIFEAFEAAGSQMQLGDIAAVCEMPLSTCHALVQTLIKRGYLYSMGRRKELYPTVKLLRLAQNIATHDPFLSRISDILTGLSQDSGETVTVGKRQGDAVLYISAFDGTHSIRYAARAGEYRPLHSTALGRALLGELSGEVLDAWIGTQTFKKVTPQTITGRARLISEIEDGRARGYFISSGEQTNDLTSVAVAIRHHAEPLAISLTGPTHRMTPLIENHGRRLLKVKKMIGELSELV